MCFFFNFEWLKVSQNREKKDLGVQAKIKGQ